MLQTGLILLCAGGSQRMGSPKQLLDYQGRSLLRHAAETAIASVCRPILVVLGSEAARLANEVADLPVRIVENSHWTEGVGTSIRAGLDAAASLELDAIVLALCDQPLVSAAVLNRLVATFQATGKKIVASQYADAVGVPALFSRDFFPHLLALKPNQGCKGVIVSNAGDTARIPCPEAETDVDTPEDYRAVQERAKPPQ